MDAITAYMKASGRQLDAGRNGPNVPVAQSNRTASDKLLNDGAASNNSAERAFNEFATGASQFFGAIGDTLAWGIGEGFSALGSLASGIGDLFSGVGDVGGGLSAGEYAAQAQAQADWEWNFDNWWNDWFGDNPVILDLDGNGVKITPYASSNVFYDTAGDGYQHRTAWAAAGDAVLAVDANNDGKIDQTNEIVFTQWDPTATSDMQALLDVFDTNHNGQLDSGDAKFAQFRLVVTNANGTQTVETLDQAGVASIDLHENNYSQTFSDGSTIDGEATFTRTNGSTGTAASVTLVSDAAGYALQTTQSVDGAGTVTIDNKAYNPNGGLDNETISITSADGNSKTLKRDVDGDGVIDLIQTDLTIGNGDGSKTETLVDATAAGVTLDKTVTWTSADGRTTSIQRDLDGNGVFEQTETSTTNGDGSRSDTISDLADNGAVIRSTLVTTSADGLTRTDRVDENGDGVWDTTITDQTIINGDASRTETASVTNADGSLRDRTMKWTSADGHSKTTWVDQDANGVWETVTTESVTANGDGSTTVVQTDFNADTSLRGRTQTWLSPDNLSKTTWVDANGDGGWDVTTTDVTVVNGDGSRTETTTDYNADGSKRDQTIVVKGADGRSRTIEIDRNGDGGFDSVETIVISGGASVDTTSDYAVNGALINRSIVSTSADGLTTTRQIDGNGGGSVDLTTTQTTVKNGDGSSTTTTAEYNRNGSLRDRSVTTTSADGLVATTTIDLNGDGSIDRTTTDATVVNGDGSQAETITQVNNNGSLRSRSVTTTSADRKHIDIVLDANGDGATDSTESRVTTSDGTTNDTISYFSANGALHGKSISTTTATGLWSATWTDLNGDGVWDTTRADSITLNADGSRWEWVTTTNADGSMRAQTAVLTSATGLSTTTWANVDGVDGWDLVTTDNITLNNDGSQWDWITDTSGDGSRRDQIAVLTSANGLSKTTWNDFDGDGNWDRINTDVTELSANGGSVHTVTDTNGAGALRDKTITTVSGDGRSTSISSDSNGDGHIDRIETTTVAANGDVIDTVVEYDPTGVGRSRTVTTTSANGLFHSVAIDQNDDGLTDLTTQSTTTLDDDGGRTTTKSDLNANGSLRDLTVTKTSSDGLSTTTWVDVDGNGAWDSTNTDVAVLNGDGSTTRTVSNFNGNGSLRDQTVTTKSSDQNSTSISHDVNGDGTIDETETLVVLSDGSGVDTISYLNSDGSVKNQRVTTTSADGLSTTTSFNTLTIGIGWVYLWGNWYPIQTQSFGATATVTDVTVLNNDGSHTRTYVHHNGDGGASVDDQIVTTVSANGLSTSSHWTGSNSIDVTTTDSTTINGDGSRTRVVSDFQTSSLSDQSITTVSASGLSTVVQLDLNGDGSFEIYDKVVVDGDGGRFETITKRNTDGSLRKTENSTVGWDGRSSSLQRDTNGDGTIDHYETSQIESDGTRTDIILDTNGDGSTRGRIVIHTSADGLSKRSEFDTNGDGLSDWSQQTTETLNGDGSRTVAVSDFNGDGSLRDRVVTTTSDDGLSKTSQIDTNGTGNAIETETDITALNGDGSSVRTVAGYYADGSLKSRTVTSMSPSGRSVSTTIDIDGDGSTDRTDATTVSSDGTTTSKVSYKDGSSVTITTSFDGRTTTLSSSSGITQTTVTMPDSSGSYSWSSTDSYGNSLGSSSHTIDANGVDKYSYTNQYASGTIRVDVATEQEDLAIFGRVYDTAFDRDMTQDEKETFGRYINSNGSLNTTQLANDLIGSTEFSSRYGGLSNLEFVERIYQNAYGRSISFNELSVYVTQLSNGTASRADLLNLVSTSSEHVLDGNVHATTNNSVTSAASYSLEHTTDRQIASDEVVRIYRTALGRAPNASELSGGVQAILSGSNTEAQIANNLVSVIWVWWPFQSNPSQFDQTFGPLTNSDFVTRLYINAFGRDPSAQESANWVSLLDSGSVSRGDAIYAIAQNVSLQDLHISIGAGTDALVLQIAEDAWQGDAQYTVSVDGNQIGDLLRASSSHADGHFDTVTVFGNWSLGSHSVSVDFLNDAYGGSASTDRNLYVEGATYDGTSVPGSQLTFLTAGSAGFSVTDTTQTIGSGPDTLALHISEDAWQGDAQYTISVDGNQIGDMLTAWSSHASGTSDTISVLGDWGAGNHVVSIDFLNDAYGYSSDADRNLYVDSATYNGAAINGSQLALYGGGPASFSFNAPS